MSVIFSIYQCAEINLKNSMMYKFRCVRTFYNVTWSLIPFK